MDGNTLIAGTACTFDLEGRPPTAWVWREGSGVTCHPVETPLWVRWAIAVSDDGRVMAGGIQFDMNAGEMESVVCHGCQGC